MIAIHFNKARADHYAAAIANGEDIQAPPGGWSGSEMLTLAGAMFAGVFSHGPALHRDVSQMHSEVREFTEEQLNRDIHAGVEFGHLLALAVIDGYYDDSFEPELVALIQSDDNGEKTLVPVKGFKDGWQEVR